MINFKVNLSRLSEIKPVCSYLNNIISIQGMHQATHYNESTVSTQTMLPAWCLYILTLLPETMICNLGELKILSL